MTASPRSRVSKYGQKPKSSREIIKAVPSVPSPRKAWDDPTDWENVTSHEGDAHYNYSTFKTILKEQGIDLSKDKRVLEIGSGNAMLLDVLKAEGINTVGVDVNPRGNKESPQAIARIEQLPFANETFDVILSVAVFDDRYYDQEHNLMIQEIARVLKHGGIYMGTLEPGRIKALPIRGFNLVKPSKSDNMLYGFTVIYKKS